MSSKSANDLASKQNLDLLCVAPNAKPPVCKILDYGKYRFEAQKRAKESRKNQKVIEIKEVRMTPQIGVHDLNVKVKQAINFFLEGNKVKVSVRFKGRQITHVEIGEKLLERFIQMVEEYSLVEKPPVLEGKFLSATLAAKKKK